MQMLRLNPKETEAIRYFRNSLAQLGRLPSVRELMNAMGYKSPRSAAVIINQLINKGILVKNQDGKYYLSQSHSEDNNTAQTVDVPLIGTISCGLPLLATENVEAYIPVSIKLAKPPQKYFILRAQGDSMNKKGIKDGDFILIKQQQTAHNGQAVVALIDESATIKEYHKTNNAIVLKPASTNPKHKPYILTSDFLIQGIVVTALPRLI